MVLEAEHDIAHPNPERPAIDLTEAQTRAEPDEPAIVILGRDDAARAHASWFTASEVELAIRAAALMQFQVLAVTTEHHRALAARVPRGRVFGSGKAFAPFVKAGLYDALLACEGVAAPAGPEPGPGQGDRAETANGRVRGRKAAQRATGGVEQGGRAKEGKAGKGPGPHAAEGGQAGPAPALTRPASWATIEVGDVVLAADGDGVWHDAVVQRRRGPDLFLIRWLYWPDIPTMARRREHLGLAHPTLPVEPA